MDRFSTAMVEDRRSVTNTRSPVTAMSAASQTRCQRARLRRTSVRSLAIADDLEVHDGARSFGHGVEGLAI